MYGDSYGDPHGYGYGHGYGDRNSVPTAALDSAVCMGIPIGIPMGMGMGIEIPSPRLPCRILREFKESVETAPTMPCGLHPCSPACLNSCCFCKGQTDRRPAGCDLAARSCQRLPITRCFRFNCAGDFLANIAYKSRRSRSELPACSSCSSRELCVGVLHEFTDVH